MISDKTLPAFQDSDSALSKTEFQYANISVPIGLKPNAIIGNIETECCGKPSIHCRQDPVSNICEVTITQKMRIKIPITYRIISCIGECEIDGCLNCDCNEL